MTENYPVIPVSNPEAVEITVSTTATKTYDRWWITNFFCPAQYPNTQINIIATLCKGHKDENGVWELSPRTEDQIQVTIEDIFTLAQSDPDVATGIGVILQLVIKYATAQGLI